MLANTCARFRSLALLIRQPKKTNKHKKSQCECHKCPNSVARFWPNKD